MKAVVALATHNPDPALFAKQIQSLLDQTEQDWRCLVFDDASDDRGHVERMCSVDPRFEMLGAHPERIGHNMAFQILLMSATRFGVPVFLCDQDDVWFPKKMELLLAQIDDGASAAFSAMRVVAPDGTVVRERFLPSCPKSDWMCPANLLRMNCVSGTSMVLSAATVQAALPFPAADLRGWHDQWLAAVAARTGRLDYVEEPLTDYTQHGGQLMGDGLRAVNWRRLRKFAVEKRSFGLLLDDLRSRTGWITAAAARLLTLSDAPDEQLQSLATGGISLHTTRWLWDGVRHDDVPAYRALLLAAGFTVSSRPARTA